MLLNIKIIIVKLHLLKCDLEKKDVENIPITFPNLVELR